MVVFGAYITRNFVLWLIDAARRSIMVVSKGFNNLIFFSFPNNVQGSIFAFLFISNLIMFGLVPIVSVVKEDYESGWATYQKWMTAMILLLTVLLILVAAIAFDKLPNWLHKVCLQFNTVENNVISAG